MASRVHAHPEEFRSGTRVLLLVSRRKDGAAATQRITRVSHDPEQFGRRHAELATMAAPGDRIYASASARNLKRASRLFRQRQLDADYDAEPMGFYRGLEGRWHSCLMSKEAQIDNLYLFDCDEPGDLDNVREQLHLHYSRDMEPYEYATKNGYHVVTQAFNFGEMKEQVQRLICRNAMMLWSY